MIIRPNTSTNHGIIGSEPIKDQARNGVSADEGVPQEGSARVCNTGLEEKKGSDCVVLSSKGGVLEHEGGTEGDTAREGSIEDGKGVNLLCLGKGVGKGAELEKVIWGTVNVRV